MSFGYNSSPSRTISFIGGSTQTFGFKLYRGELTKPFSLYRCEASFSLIHAVNKKGIPILSKKVGTLVGADGVDNVVFVEILPEETVDLNGKFIYQIAVKDMVDGKVEIPDQGVMYITDNIDKENTRNWG